MRGNLPANAALLRHELADCLGNPLLLFVAVGFEFGFAHTDVFLQADEHYVKRLAAVKETESRHRYFLSPSRTIASVMLAASGSR